MEDRESQDFERRWRALSAAQQELALLRLKDVLYALLSVQPKKWQMERAAFLGVKLTEFDRN